MAMYKKLSKYWLNFSSLLMLVGLFSIPFISFVKYKVPTIPPTGSQVDVVLSSASSSKVFSEVVYSQIVEATFSAKQNIKDFDPLARIKNASTKAKDYKIILKELVENAASKESSSSFDAVAYFTSNGKDYTSLAQSEPTDLVLSVNRKGSARSVKYLVLVLTTL